jgi:hypothetical protein
MPAMTTRLSTVARIVVATLLAAPTSVLAHPIDDFREMMASEEPEGRPIVVVPHIARFVRPSKGLVPPSRAFTRLSRLQRVYHGVRASRGTRLADVSHWDLRGRYRDLLGTRRTTPVLKSGGPTRTVASAALKPSRSPDRRAPRGPAAKGVKSGRRR